MGEYRSAQHEGTPVRAHRSGGLVLRASASLLLAVLAACGTAVRSPDATVPSGGAAADEMPLPSQAQSPNPAYERKQRERAVQLTRQGRLADAVIAWEVLTVLRPDAIEYRDRLAEVRRQADAVVADRLQRATQMQKRGELDAAAQQYLAVLALQPDQAQAADALRAIERERNKRNFLGKYSRLTLTRRSMADATVPLTAPESNELEHASILASQGDVDDAIAVLERRVAADRRDDQARLLLADVYVQKAEALAARDRKGALAVLDKCLRLEPTHARALALQKQLRAGVAPAAAGAAASAPLRSR
jgi:tetratricopeptide (TPR) repeat protein